MILKSSYIYRTHCINPTMIPLISFCLFTVPFYTLAADPMSDANKELLVNLHNKLRSQEGAADMQMMTWNNDLEGMAADWADGCSFDHGHPYRDPEKRPFDKIGQNLRVTLRITLNLTQGIQTWYDEKYSYDFETRFCSYAPCGHYTQVVWNWSYALGCAWKDCTVLTNAPFSTGVLLVCNYGPSGNYQTQPYTKGEPCSKCDSRKGWCHNGLCNRDCTGPSDTCECKANCGVCGRLDPTSCECVCANGWTGADCKTQCKDMDETCNHGWPPYWCTSEYDYVLQSCPLMCKTCEPDDGSCNGVDAPEPCLFWTCANGGLKKVSGDACVCECINSWEGAHCQVYVSDTKIGGRLRVESPISDWSSVWATMKPIIADTINEYCHDHVQHCCPNATLKTSDSMLNYTTMEYVEVMSGYPVEVESGERPITEAVVFSIGAPGNQFCLSLRANRRKRAVSRHFAPLLPSRVIVAAITRQQYNISKALSDCCGATLISVHEWPEPSSVDGTLTAVDGT